MTNIGDRDHSLLISIKGLPPGICHVSTAGLSLRRPDSQETDSLERTNPMATQSGVDFFHNWAKERIDEMDATVTSLKSKAAELRAEKQHQTIFESQVTAQMNAWHDAANQIQAAAAEFAAERRKDIDATVSRMRADAAAADERLQKLARAGTESWSALSAALAETRGVFDHANQAAREAFKRAAEPAH
jgi:4-hydroxy-3-methylbut-2-enyl diphosphate reductase IspH